MSLPSDSTLEDVQVRIRKSIRNPNVGRVEQVVLREGPRAFRLATLFEILDPAAGGVHHYSLKLDSVNRKKDGWFYKPEKSITLESGDPDEIGRLFRFLQAHVEGKLGDTTADIHIIGSEEYKKLESLVELIPDLASPDMVELVKRIVPNIEDAGAYIDEFIGAFEESDPATVEHLAVASRWVKHKRAYDELQEMIDDPSLKEKDFQDLLERNPWMFGSEYSELLDRRRWSRDDSLDFMLRRTSDNYLEILEIKTPFKEDLLIYDKAHDGYYLSSKLSAVLGQVMGYVTEIERSRDQILSKDDQDPLKIRARVIIGRDGSAKQQEALRNLNAHLHRIEILTFDQMARIAGRVIGIFRDNEGQSQGGDEGDDDIPF